MRRHAVAKLAAEAAQATAKLAAEAAQATAWSPIYPYPAYRAMST
jgi:hypothetical protein